MRLPAAVLEEFRRHGRQGGRTRALRTPAAERRRIARTAAVTRWTRSRFGVSRFAELALPGGDLVDRGLADLAANRTTPEALLVSLAAPRLRREGVPVGEVEAQPEIRLYEMLSRSEGDLAHARYTAYLRRLVSFADACHLLRAVQ